MSETYNSLMLKNVIKSWEFFNNIAIASEN